MITRFASIFVRGAINKVIFPQRSFHLFRRYQPFLDFDEDRKFRLMLDVEDFHPRDIDVKIEEKRVKITAHKNNEHRNWRDSTQITREYDLPDDVDPSSVKSSVDSGVLVIEGDRRIAGDATQMSNEKEYIMNIDLNGFKPEEVSVKQNGDEIIVEAKQEIKNVGNDQSQSKLFRRFIRRFNLPHHINKEEIKAKYTSDGRLVLSSLYTQLPKPQEKDIVRFDHR
ncbi:hypothetical protein HZS_7248 [Henneguya salminicola]|nr:hypothetical protein HZS_7248 [Henneguya salminicola]